MYVQSNICYQVYNVWKYKCIFCAFLIVINNQTLTTNLNLILPKMCG